MNIDIKVNGTEYRADVEPRLTLVDFLRYQIGLTGTHVGCEHGVCGACTILLDGTAVRSCLMFAVQADGHMITTVEGLAESGGQLSPLQEAFVDKHAMQCGYCTSGMLMAATGLLAKNPHPSRDEIKSALSGNLCRCTGYQQILEAVEQVAASEG